MTSAEEWRAFPGWDAYEVSSFGRVRRVRAARGARAGRLMKLKVRDNGYLVVTLKQDGREKNIRINRAVCEAFNGPAPDGKPHAAHEDGTRDNNTPDNLRWSDVPDNHADKLRHGTHNRGERHPLAKLTADAVREIRAATVRPGYRLELAQRFGIGADTIKQIRRRAIWKWLE